MPSLLWAGFVKFAWVLLKKCTTMQKVVKRF